MGAANLSEVTAASGAAEIWASAKQLRNAGRPADAISLLEILCARHPGEFRYALSMAEMLVGESRLEDAAPFLARARQIGAPDPKTAEILDRLSLRHGLLRLEQAGNYQDVLCAYHDAVRQTPSTVRKIEEWSPIVNRAGEALWRQAGERVGSQAAQIIEEVRERGIAVRTFEQVVGEMGLLRDLQTVARTTEDWTVPGKPHFFKAMKEEAAAVWHPIMKAGLHPSLLEIANGFYGLYTRLVSANVVLTKADRATERMRQGSEGWHRDPEDTPMFK
ncbi:MAG TPA: hypothetical protein VIJ94_02440, partial [Caulobacteraceae bacterium]